TGSQSMTGGRLLRLKKLFKEGDTFMLTYGDGVADVNIDELVKFHKSHGKAATLTCVRPPARFGSIVSDDNNFVQEFKEKPQIGEGWINGGFFVFNYSVFDLLTDDGTILEREPLETLAARNELAAFKHDGFWHCMDTVRDKDNLNEIWATGKAPWKKW
ncbi:MAG: glucose-1-phosphate cytidylyltransferase, partial [Chitinophagaceae bacterium]|nr:glucose-1-phosphate cytidylyltransferase [Chitinophagaceae bacterium]